MSAAFSQGPVFVGLGPNLTGRGVNTRNPSLSGLRAGGLRCRCHGAGVSWGRSRWRVPVCPHMAALCVCSSAPRASAEHLLCTGCSAGGWFLGYLVTRGRTRKQPRAEEVGEPLSV